MLEHFSADDLAVEVRMVRAVFDGTLLLVEGTSDYKLFRGFTDETVCRLLPSHGRQRALGAVELLEESGVPGVLCVVDADYWHMEDEASPSPNVIPTDTHDIEVLQLCSQALGRFMDEYGSAKKTESFLAEETGASLSEVLLARVLPLGQLRRLSFKQGLNLRFEGLKFLRFTHLTTLSLDTDSLISGVLSLTRDPEIDPDALRAALDELLQETVDPKQCCCGHDAIEVLAAGLRRAVGSQPAKVAKPAFVEVGLRLAFDSRDLESTDLYRLASDWEAANPPYRIFSIGATS